jgi:hypothetical protein
VHSVDRFPYREKLQDELTAAIEREPLQSRHRWQLGLAAGGAACAVVALFAIAVFQGDEETTSAPAEQTATRSSPPSSAEAFITPEFPEMSLATAVQKSPFDVRMPDTPAANRSNLRTVFAQPGNAILLEFPAPTESSSDLRQPNLAVYEAPWDYGDPLAFYESDVKESPMEGETVCSVGDLPALCVTPRSPSDEEQANPAFVRVKIGDLEVQVAGGDDLDAAIAVAESLAKPEATL